MSENLFILTIGGADSTATLVRDGRYGYSNSAVNDENFPIRPRRILTRTIEIIVPRMLLTSDEMLQEFEHKEVERPTYEDALYFGAAYPKEQERHAIVFLHKPFPLYGRPCTIVLYGVSGYRCLELDFLNLWFEGFAFAAVRKDA